MSKEIIVSVGKDADASLMISLQSAGIRTIFGDPSLVEGTEMSAMYGTDGNSYVIRGPGGEQSGRRYRILSNADIDTMLHEAATGLDFVIADVEDWKIIPLENAIAKLHDLDTRIITTARNVREARKMLSILEIGVDGVILDDVSTEDLSALAAISGSGRFELMPAKVTGVQEVGDGERVCVDTASMLGSGEGMLVGNKSNFLFLVHNESVGSSFTSPRPFRVNAGAVHCYALSADGTTKYLSEVESGVEVLVVDANGSSRRATVGRSKIERRPMLLITAVFGDVHGGIIAQNAETIRFVRPGGELVSVTHLKDGDEILVHVTEAAGRHFGMRVDDEYILEK